MITLNKSLRRLAVVAMISAIVLMVAGIVLAVWWMEEAFG